MAIHTRDTHLLEQKYVLWTRAVLESGGNIEIYVCGAIYNKENGKAGSWKGCRVEM